MLLVVWLFLALTLLRYCILHCTVHTVVCSSCKVQWLVCCSVCIKIAVADNVEKLQPFRCCANLAFWSRLKIGPKFCDSKRSGLNQIKHIERWTNNELDYKKIYSIYVYKHSANTECLYSISICVYFKERKCLFEFILRACRLFSLKTEISFGLSFHYISWLETEVCSIMEVNGALTVSSQKSKYLQRIDWSGSQFYSAGFQIIFVNTFVYYFFLG